MINADNEVSLAYLLEPTFQVENTEAKPITNGYIEVYLHGTRTKYYCASDFDGTLHPFKIPLDSLGSNIVLASPAHAYDIYIYNKYGTLVMSRYNIVPATGDGAVIKDIVTIKSEDGTISVKSQDQTNLNLSIKDTVDRVQQNEQEISNVKVDTTTLPNDVQYDLSVNTDIIATNEYVDAQVSEEAESRSHEDELIRNSIPTKTSQISNDSGFINTDDIYNGRIVIHLTPLQKYSNYLDMNNLSTRFSGFIDNKLRIALFGTSINVINNFTPWYSASDGVGEQDWPALAYFEIPNFVANENISVITSIINSNRPVIVICYAGSNKFGICVNKNYSINTNWYDTATVPIMF